MSYQNIQTETKGRVGIIRFNRPQALNALNAALVLELKAAIDAFEADDAIGCILITGSEKAFAAGADIKEMAGQSYTDVNLGDFAGNQDRIARARKPVVAAVAGFALGGGCEMAMQCDLIIAADSAKFGQPEIKLGVIPGIGGTQRLTRAVGKALAMDVILSGRRLTAQEALAAGLVSRVVAREAWLEEPKRLAREIAAKGPVATRLAKESVNRAYETTLQAGLEAERRALYLAFASEDAKEGLTAFTEKREPDFKGR